MESPYKTEMVAHKSDPGSGRLDSWKAIADYLRRDVSTVRRWEKTAGLPVRRLAGSQSVFAYPADIDAWLRAMDAHRGQESTSDPLTGHTGSGEQADGSWVAPGPGYGPSYLSHRSAR